jgi:OOP family OmpA-OmpF porin
MKYRLFLLFLIPSLTLVAQGEDDFLMYSIYFGGGSYYIDEEQEKGLYEFIDKVEEIENYTISVHGHTDNIGSKVYNEWLSMMRGESVIQLLMEREIMREMIKVKSFGKFNPVYDNSTFLGQLKNRRVDVILWPISI